MLISDTDIKRAAILVDARRQDHVIVKMSNGKTFCQIASIWAAKYDLLLKPKDDKVIVYDENGKEVKKISLSQPVVKDKAKVKTKKPEEKPEKGEDK